METDEAARATTRVRESLTRVAREIENLLRAIEAGDAPPALLARLRDREHERAALESQLAATSGIHAATELDRGRIRRILDEGLSRLSDVFASDRIGARPALAQVLASRVRFTPIDLSTGARTYRFEARSLSG